MLCSTASGPGIQGREMVMMIKRNGYRQINIQDIPSAELSGPKYLLNP